MLTIHVSRNQQTIGMYSDEVLDKLKPGVFIINTARGRIFDETALYERFNDGRINAAAFDIFEIEPAIDTPLYPILKHQRLKYYAFNKTFLTNLIFFKIISRCL